MSRKSSYMVKRTRVNALGVGSEERVVELNGMVCRWSCERVKVSAD